MDKWRKTGRKKVIFRHYVEYGCFLHKEKSVEIQYFNTLSYPVPAGFEPTAFRSGEKVWLFLNSLNSSESVDFSMFLSIGCKQRTVRGYPPAVFSLHHFCKNDWENESLNSVLPKIRRPVLWSFL